MVLLWIIERRVLATVVLGVPLLTSMIVGYVWDKWSKYGIVYVVLLYYCTTKRIQRFSRRFAIVAAAPPPQATWPRRRKRSWRES